MRKIYNRYSNLVKAAEWPDTAWERAAANVGHELQLWLGEECRVQCRECQF